MVDAPPAREPLVPKEPVLEHLGLTENAFYSMRHRGDAPPAYRVGRRLMFRWSEVEQWLAGRREQPEPAAS
jgi:predicted DNA-binding transcriptional regulator AlpA